MTLSCPESRESRSAASAAELPSAKADGGASLTAKSQGKTQDSQQENSDDRDHWNNVMEGLMSHQGEQKTNELNDNISQRTV